MWSFTTSVKIIWIQSTRRTAYCDGEVYRVDQGTCATGKEQVETYSTYGRYTTYEFVTNHGDSSWCHHFTDSEGHRTVSSGIPKPAHEEDPRTQRQWGSREGRTEVSGVRRGRCGDTWTKDEEVSDTDIVLTGRKKGKMRRSPRLNLRWRKSDERITKENFVK